MNDVELSLHVHKLRLISINRDNCDSKNKQKWIKTKTNVNSMKQTSSCSLSDAVNGWIYWRWTLLNLFKYVNETFMKNIFTSVHFHNLNRRYLSNFVEYDHVYDV